MSCQPSWDQPGGKLLACLVHVANVVCLASYYWLGAPPRGTPLRGGSTRKSWSASGEHWQWAPILVARQCFPKNNVRHWIKTRITFPIHKRYQYAYRSNLIVPLHIVSIAETLCRKYNITERAITSACYLLEYIKGHRQRHWLLMPIKLLWHNIHHRLQTKNIFSPVDLAPHKRSPGLPHRPPIHMGNP